MVKLSSKKFSCHCLHQELGQNFPQGARVWCKLDRESRLRQDLLVHAVWVLSAELTFLTFIPSLWSATTVLTPAEQNLLTAQELNQGLNLVHSQAEHVVGQWIAAHIQQHSFHLETKSVYQYTHHRPLTLVYRDKAVQLKPAIFFALQRSQNKNSIDISLDPVNRAEAKQLKLTDIQLATVLSRSQLKTA